MTDGIDACSGERCGNLVPDEEDELPIEALHREQASQDKNDLHASLDLVSHTQRTGARGDGLVGRGRITGFEDSFDDSMSLGESFAIDDRDEPRRANPNTYKQLEAIQDMTEEDDEEEDSEGSDDDQAQLIESSTTAKKGEAQSHVTISTESY